VHISGGLVVVTDAFSSIVVARSSAVYDVVYSEHDNTISIVF
jgi:hypothetical protein